MSVVSKDATVFILVPVKALVALLVILIFMFKSSLVVCSTSTSTSTSSSCFFTFLTNAVMSIAAMKKQRREYYNASDFRNCIEKKLKGTDACTFKYKKKIQIFFT